MKMASWDIRFFGLPYTCFNNRAPVAAVFELERVVAKQQLLNLYKDARVENLSVVISAHFLRMDSGTW